MPTPAEELKTLQGNVTIGLKYAQDYSKRSTNTPRAQGSHIFHELDIQTFNSIFEKLSGNPDAFAAFALMVQFQYNHRPGW
ncbi:MAG: hypothetical protein EBQ80_04710 [Proteobacteria bacterium]|nr:hypothetical protein [Pseudomonadota bacterium]